MKGRELETKKMRNKKDFFLLWYDPYRKFRHTLMLKIVNCGNIITIIAVMVQRIYDVILLYLCSSFPSKIRVADMLVEEK